MKKAETFSILTIGDSNVGKTALSSRFCLQTSKKSYQETVGIDMHFRTVLLSTQVLKITIWDTAGQEKYSFLTPNCIRKAEGILFVYDISDPKTFSSIPNYIMNMQNYVSDIPFVLVANKIDLNRKNVSSEEGMNFAKKNNILYFETSARTGKGVDNALFGLIQEIMIKRGHDTGELNNFISNGYESNLSSTSKSENVISCDETQEKGSILLQSVNHSSKKTHRCYSFC